MTREDAKKVLKIMYAVDGGELSPRVSDLFVEFFSTFPEHKELALESLREEFGGTLTQEQWEKLTHQKQRRASNAFL